MFLKFSKKKNFKILIFAKLEDSKYLPHLWKYSMELKDELNNLKQVIEKFKSTKAAPKRMKFSTELSSRTPKSSRCKYSRQFIENKISQIGKKKINYREYLKRNYFWSRFAINAKGSFVIFCYNNYDVGELLLFNSKCELTMKADVTEAKSHYVIGMANELIYLACIIYDTEADELNNKKVQIDSFNLDLVKINSHTKFIPFLAELYPIDVNEMEIYLKTSSRQNSISLNYEIHVLTKNLVEINSFHLKKTIDVLSIKVKNEFLVYTTKENNNYTFRVQSLRNQKFSKTFKVDAHDAQISWDMGENSNLFLLNCNTNKISEYNFNGRLVKCIKIPVESSGILISPCFDFIITNVFIDFLYVS